MSNELETYHDICAEYPSTADPRVFDWIEKTIAKNREEEAKAFGGCRNCYGKGYGTQTLNYSARRFSKRAPTVVFCKCSRGRQLEELFSRE